MEGARVARKHRTTPSYDPRSVNEHIIETPLNEELSTSFLEYAYSVIYARALPDARDGLKPVQRRIIYQMGQMNLSSTRPHMKSARVVGEVMGKLHPHGDSAIYEAMVRLAQPFAMRIPLVDGHGNFGSLDDGPAASRYTEARLAPPALGMNADIDEHTVDFAPNYDNRLQEPEVLPAAIPNLLVNGSSGIAVGMATNMITHNLAEVVAAAQYRMAHPECTLDELMQFVPGPDLPGGGIIMGRDGIREAYEHGRGSFTTRAVTHIENVTARKKGIVVTELPYMVGPEKVLERISEGVRNKKLDGISSAIDLTDRHNGTRLVIEVKTGFSPEAVLSQLFKHTPLEDSFTINNVALVHGRPHTMGLAALLDVWIEHRRMVIRRRSEYRKQRAQERLHLVEGLLLALVDIDEVIQVIRTSDNADIALTRLMAVFDLDEVQARHILDLRLRRLTKLSRIELDAERDELQRTIEELDRILSSQEELDAVVSQAMDDAVTQWGNARRTVILDQDESGVWKPVSSKAHETSPAHIASTAALAVQQAHVVEHAASAIKEARHDSDTLQEALTITDEPCAVVLLADGRIGRVQTQVLETGKLSLPVRSLFATHTTAQFGLIASSGRLVLAQVSSLPLLGLSTSMNASDLKSAMNSAIDSHELLLGTEHTEPVAGERVIAAVDMEDTTPLALGTASGVVKRWNRQSPTTMDSWSIIDLKDRDTVLAAAPADDTDRLVFISSDASLLTFEAEKVRAQGRNSAGMAGIRLADDASCIFFGVVRAGTIAWTTVQSEDGLTTHQSGAVVVTIAGDSDSLEGLDTGAAKVTPLELFPVKGRATGGVRSQRFLKGQNTLLHAYVGSYPVFACTATGTPVELPSVDMRRDGSGIELAASVAFLS